MKQPERISSWQLGVLIYVSMIGTTFLLMPSVATALAGNDMWITPILAALGGGISVWAAARLYKLYPGKHFFGALEAAFGRGTGKIVGFLFLLFHIHISGATLRDYGEFIASNFFEKTPMSLLLGSMVLVCGLGVRAGAETLARCAQVFMPFILLLLAINIILLIPEMDVREMLPIWGQGTLPIVKGAIVVKGWYCQFMLISFLYPYLDAQAKPLKIGLQSVLAVMITLLLICLTVLFLFGSTAAKFYYPFLMASRYIRVADFIEHVEAMVMMSWVLGAFIHLSMFYFVMVAGFSAIFQVKDDRLLTLPSGFLFCIMGLWVAPSLQALTAFIGSWGTYYDIFGYMVFPAMIALIASLRERFRAPVSAVP